MAGTKNDVLIGKNADFSQVNAPNGSSSESNGLVTDGQLWIGSTSTNAGGTHINVGNLTSPDSSITFGYSSPNITAQVSSGTTVGKTITGDTGGALSPTAGNWNILGSGSITTSGSGSTLTTQLTGLTNHAVLVGAGTTTITNIGPSSTTGQVFQNNAGADPSYSTATYPSVATGTGTILRANGTNWVPTTSTYPNTNAINTLLYASSANVMSALATANSGVLTTSSTGVPSIDTTNFHVLTTGVQTKGNNTNTAPPAGFIGEQIRATVASGSAITLASGTVSNITSISLTAGIWDVSGIGMFSGSITGTNSAISINTVSATLGTAGDNYVQTPVVSTSTSDSALTIPAYRLTLSTTTTVYIMALVTFTVGTAKAYGRISATRVG